MQTLESIAVTIGIVLTKIKIKTNIKVQMTKLYKGLVILKKLFVNKLSKFVAWISSPEKTSEIGVLLISAKACA